MSKVDAQRAMREARYAAERAAGAGRRKTPAAAAAAPAAASARTPAAAKDVAKDAPTVAAGLCGHRSMNNRTCRRPAGHAEKNHRYS